MHIIVKKNECSCQNLKVFLFICQILFSIPKLNLYLVQNLQFIDNIRNLFTKVADFWQDHSFFLQWYAFIMQRKSQVFKNSNIYEFKNMIVQCESVQFRWLSIINCWKTLVFVGSSGSPWEFNDIAGRSIVK